MKLTVQQEKKQSNALTGKDSIGRGMSNVIKDPSTDSITKSNVKLEPVNYQDVLQRRLRRI